MAIRKQSGLHHPSAVYAKQVTQGKLQKLCCPYEIKACQRHLDDLRRQGTDDFPYVFDTTRADRILRWFGQCVQVRGPFAGRPVEPQPWQVFDLSCVYGWVHRDTGARRFNRTYHKRARGNVKSTEVSCKCLYHMCADAIYPPYRPELARFEREPEVECAAVDRGQAMRVFGDAKKIASASPSIARRLIIPRSNPVVHRTRGGFMRALSKDTKNKDSGAPSYFEVDEYHAHPTSDIYDLGKDSFGKRWQSLLDVITTAGDGADSKPCFREEQYARQVLDGAVIDDRYFVMIRELPLGADPHNKALWPMANPVLRYPNEYSGILLGEIESEYTAAYGSGDPDKLSKFLTRRMCQWQAESVNSYLDARCMELARRAQVSRADFAALTDGQRCYCGFDLGKRIDLSGAAAVFTLPDGRVAIKAHGFLPENAAERHEQTDRVPYRAYAQGGFCTLTPGDVTDNSYVYSWICAGERDQGWQVEEVDYDGHNATDLAIRMNEERNREDFCVEVPQTCAGQNLAVKGFRELLLQGKLVLEESPLLIRCLGNAIEIPDNYGNVKLSKRHKDDSQRIDPVAAAMNALARALVRRDHPTLADRIEQGDWGM
ncbi:MAG: terminase large subunit [Oscillospiraceae bacterium]|nr:terminase large subunit [Oscillospiraceae bacterium]